MKDDGPKTKYLLSLSTDFFHLCRKHSVDHSKAKKATWRKHKQLVITAPKVNKWLKNITTLITGSTLNWTIYNTWKHLSCDFQASFIRLERTDIKEMQIQVRTWNNSAFRTLWSLFLHNTIPVGPFSLRLTWIKDWSGPHPFAPRNANCKLQSWINCSVFIFRILF